jgi:hypothetical protein
MDENENRWMYALWCEARHLSVALNIADMLDAVEVVRRSNPRLARRVDIEAREFARQQQRHWRVRPMQQREAQAETAQQEVVFNDAA